MEGMNKPQLFLLASLALFISSWKYECLWNHEAAELWSIFQIWFWCGQQPLVIRESEIAGSFLWQGTFNSKDMKKNKLPSSTKSDPNFFKVFWTHHGSWGSLSFLRGLLWMAYIIYVKRLVWQCAETLNFILRQESSLFVSEQHSVNYFCFPPYQLTNLPRVCYSCMGLAPSHIKNILPMPNYILNCTFALSKSIQVCSFNKQM